MSETNKYVELAVWLGASIKGAGLMAAEEILTESTHVLTEAYARLKNDGFDQLAGAALKGLEFTHIALEKVQAL